MIFVELIDRTFGYLLIGRVAIVLNMLNAFVSRMLHDKLRKCLWHELEAALLLQGKTLHF